MKKYLLIIILYIFLYTINISALEEIIPIRKENKFIGVKDIITIENNEKETKVELVALKGLNAYTSINKKDKFKINIIINNKDYEYLKDSLKIKKYKYNKENTIYRTINKPLKKLYNYKNINLEDKVLNKKLIEKGYLGIEELDEYYKDYYKCDKLTEKELKKIIKGKQTYIKESNNIINELAYNYYYKNIFIIKNNGLNIDVSLNKKNYTYAYTNYNYDMNITLVLKKIE